MAGKEIDPLTGLETTGHEWDGVKELNTPLPKWWLYVFYATILFSVVYCILYPAWPLGTASYTKGVLGYSSRAELVDQMAQVREGRGTWLAQFEDLPVEEVAENPDLLRFAMAGGRYIFADNCAPCHGAGGQGAPGYPVLADDDWLWGGTLDAIMTTINHGVRSNDVLGYISRDALAIDVTNAILARVEEEGFTVPPGYTFEVAGDSEQQADALGDLLTYLPVLLMLMVGTIVLSFRSNRLAALIGVVAVLSVGLGMLSLWIGGYARGFNAIIGSVGLVGVAINGTIVVLAAIRANARSRAGELTAIVGETIGATRHIVSTTATTVGGFIPLLLFTGGDFWPPLAIVIAGGVGFSVTLSLVFTPTMYHWLHRDRARTAERPALARLREAWSS